MKQTLKDDESREELEVLDIEGHFRPSRGLEGDQPRVGGMILIPSLRLQPVKVLGRSRFRGPASGGASQPGGEERKITRY